jgi:FemAB-related protein (PEP-CTERM system-associated)
VTPAAEWDRFVRAQPGWTHFHLHAWKDVLERAFGHECPYLESRSADGRLQAVLPLVRVRSVLFGHYLVSLPFVNYGGPLGEAVGIREVVSRAVALAQVGRVKLLELRSPQQLPVDLSVSHRKITVLLDLPPGGGSAEPVWQALPGKVRSQVRRPQKEGVSVTFGLDQLDAFYGVFSHHMRDLGTPVQSRGLFQAIAETFPDDVWFGCAYLQGRAIAAGCGFRWGDEFEMTWASSLREYNQIAPNMLLYWGFLERCVGLGVRRFNFGRCTPDSGTHKFKRQWGGRDEPLWWYQYTLDGAAAATPSPDDAAYAWGPRLWRHLPLPVANLLGPRIVRYVP